MKIPVRVPRVVTPGTRMVVEAVQVETGGKVAAGDPVLTIRIGNLPASLHSPATGIIQDIRATAGDELMADRVVLWVESDALPPFEFHSPGTSASAAAEPSAVAFHLPDVLLPARIPKIQRVLVQAGDTVLPGTAVMEVSLGIVRFNWASPVKAILTQVLVRAGDELREGMALLKGAGTLVANTPPVKVPTPKLEMPELSLAEFRQRSTLLRGEMKELSALISKAGLTNSAQLLQAEIARLEKARFTIAVVGEFKRGKSTFLNALAGGEFLPNDVIPCTSFACRFQYGEELQLALLGNDGVESVSKLKTLPEVAAELDRLTRDPQTAIREAIIRLPLELCREGVDLLDTPGLNDSEAMNQVTLSVLPNVDAAVLLLIPENPLSDTEKRFLEDHLLARDIGRVLFVLNAKDRVTPAQLTRLFEYLQRRIQEIVSARDASATADAKLMCVSSRAELSGASEDESGFGALRMHLSRLLFQQRGRLLLLQSLQRVRRTAGESQAAVQLRIAQSAASREGFLVSLLDVERQLATTRLYSNDLRLRLVEAQAQAQALAANHARQLHAGLLSLRETLPPQVGPQHTRGGPEKFGPRLGSVLHQNAGRYFQRFLTALLADVRAVYDPMADQIRTFVETAYAASISQAAITLREATSTAQPWQAPKKVELEIPDLLSFSAGIGFRIDLSIGALSWLYLMESANLLLSRGELQSTLEARALERLRVSYAQEIERQIKANASEATLTLRFGEFARRPFNELMRRLDQELKVLLDDALATLATLRTTARHQGDAQQMEDWKTIHNMISAAAEHCEAIVFAQDSNQSERGLK